MPALLLDRFLLLETPQRISISWTTLSASGASMFFFLVLPLLRPWSLLRCAAAIEKAQRMMAKEMREVTGGLSIPGL